MSTALAAVVGPVLGLLVVIVAYCLGVCLSIKCCSPTSDSDQGIDQIISTGSNHQILPSGLSAHLTRYHRSPGLDIFVVSRSEDYLINIPRPTLMGRQYPRSALGHENHFVSLAPEYEEPPTYEECVRDGLA